KRKQKIKIKLEAVEAKRRLKRAQCDPNKPFIGGLGQKRKGELRDIAYALGLSVEGVKDEILARIERHFEQFPDLRDDARYVGLF
ncbi:hypothetical protein BDQ17DRAFT_1189324, partial [Cyathus striatus]